MPDAMLRSRATCEFGLATESEGVIGRSQQFGQRPSADGDAGVGELVEQRRRWGRRRARDSDVGLPRVIGVEAFDERSGCLFGAVGGRRSFGAGGGQVGQQLLALAAAPRQDGERVVVEGLGEQVEGGGEVLARDGVIEAGAVQRALSGWLKGLTIRLV